MPVIAPSSRINHHRARATGSLHATQFLHRLDQTPRGRLRLLPPLQPSTEILSRASRQAYHEVKEDASIANAKRRTQKRGTQTIDLFAQKHLVALTRHHCVTKM